MSTLPISGPVETLVQCLDAKRSGKSWIAKCPAHDDRTPSLSIDEGADGRVLLKCFAGCDTRNVVAALGLTPGDLFITPPAAAHQRKTRNKISAESHISAADRFLSEQDCLRAIEMAVTLRETPNLCERIAGGRGWKPETIKSLTYDPSLGWHEGKLAFIYETGVKLRWRQQGERIIRWAFGCPWLWRGSLIDTAQTIYLCEGETDAISLIDSGIESDGCTRVAAIPSASTFHERWATYFAGKEVILAFDADLAGEKATHRVSGFLQPHVVSLKQVNWGGLQRAS